MGFDRMAESTFTTLGLVRGLGYERAFQRRVFPRDRIAPPASPVTSTATTGGTVAAGLYTIAVTVVDGNGVESYASVVVTQGTSGSTSTLTVDSPAAGGGAVSWYAYVSQANLSVLHRQQAAGSPSAIGTDLVLTAPPTTGGALPPTVAAPFTETVPGATMRRYVLVAYDLSTGAPAGNRVAQLGVKDSDGHVLFNFATGVNQLAGTVTTNFWIPGFAPYASDTQGDNITPMPDLFL
ncbi:MAG: hypothetical protein ACREQ5_07640, partial [Candidatus Dormibacteria bacterium]